ncbi:hypothetical protein D3C80_711030 [compost metagenome]
MRLNQIGREPAQEEEQDVVVAEESERSDQDDRLFQVVTQPVCRVAQLFFRAVGFLFHPVDQRKFLIADPFAFRRIIRHHEEPHQHPDDTDRADNHKRRSPAERQCQIADDWPGDGTTQR